MATACDNNICQTSKFPFVHHFTLSIFYLYFAFILYFMLLASKNKAGLSCVKSTMQAGLSCVKPAKHVAGPAPKLTHTHI